MRVHPLCALVLFTIALSPLIAHAGLTHRYSFNDGTANDSVGGANGLLVNGATVTGGQLHLNPAAQQFVALPSNILKTTNFTVEAWATMQSTLAWQRIIDLGNSGGNGYIMMTPYNGAGTVTGQINLPNGGGSNFAAGPTQFGNGTISTGVQYQFVFVHDFTDDVEALYVNGVPVINQGSTPFVATVNPTLENLSSYYLGRSQFSADPYMAGSINELRTYDQALSPAQVQAEYLAGPDAVTVPEPASVGIIVLGMALITGRRSQRTLRAC